MHRWCLHGPINSGPGYMVVDMAQVKMLLYIEIFENCFCHENICCGYQDDFCLFVLILYVHSTIFQLCGTVLPGFNQY